VDRHQAAARSDLERLVARARAGELGPAPEAHRYDPAAHGDFRPAAVLLLFTPTTVPAAGFPGLDLFLVQRSPLLRAHPGQIALPGGGADPGDAGPAGTALREAHEEIGLAPERVAVLGEPPPVPLPVSRLVGSPDVGRRAGARGLAAARVGAVPHA